MIMEEDHWRRWKKNKDGIKRGDQSRIKDSPLRCYTQLPTGDQAATQEAEEAVAISKAASEQLEAAHEAVEAVYYAVEAFKKTRRRQ
ncbi:thiocyanate hydrolase subunit alpha domain protein [Ostertagia ostertagi]